MQVNLPSALTVSCNARKPDFNNCRLLPFFLNKQDDDAYLFGCDINHHYAITRGAVTFV